MVWVVRDPFTRLVSAEYLCLRRTSVRLDYPSTRLRGRPRHLPLPVSFSTAPVQTETVPSSVRNAVANVETRPLSIVGWWLLS